MTKHTPGEWIIEPYENFDQIAILGMDGEGSRVLAVTDNNDLEDKANAQLIAAAPDLLEACKHVGDQGCLHPKWAEWGISCGGCNPCICNDAIDKATLTNESESK